MILLCLFLCGKREEEPFYFIKETKHTNDVKEEPMIMVEWERANELELETLLEMAEDGYCFCVGDGRICSIGIALGTPA